jgi:uncharacterized membrane protein YsdA (DUF1294 family)
MIDAALFAAYLLAINALTFAAFVHDKRAARRGEWRVAERTLLLFALIGGTPGAYAARHFVRHKTRKQPFMGRLHLILALQITAILVLAGNLGASLTGG